MCVTCVQVNGESSEGVEERGAAGMNLDTKTATVKFCKVSNSLIKVTPTDPTPPSDIR